MQILSNKDKYIIDIKKFSDASDEEIESAIENAKAVSLPPSPIITDNIGVSRFNLVDINSLIENARPEYSDLRDNSG